MKYRLELELQNVYGGDGYVRQIQVENPKIQKTRKRTTVRKDIGVPVESEQSTTETETGHVDIGTFKRDEQGNYYLRLGGSHGKLWGTLKSIGNILVMSGDELIKYKNQVAGLMQAINILPNGEVKLENVKNVHVQKLPQLLNNMGRNSMIIQRFDVIESCTVSVDVVFPEVMKPVVEKLLRGLEDISSLNKRRSVLKVLSSTLVPLSKDKR